MERRKKCWRKIGRWGEAGTKKKGSEICQSGGVRGRAVKRLNDVAAVGEDWKNEW